MPHFEGPPDTPDRAARLSRQHDTIRDLMRDGHWRSLPAIAAATRAPEASVSAQLRHLRKPRFGGYVVEKRHVAGGLWEYRLLPPPPRDQGELFGKEGS